MRKEGQPQTFEEKAIAFFGKFASNKKARMGLAAGTAAAGGVGIAIVRPYISGENIEAQAATIITQRNSVDFVGLGSGQNLTQTETKNLPSTTINPRLPSKRSADANFDAAAHAVIFATQADVDNFPTNSVEAGQPNEHIEERFKRAARNIRLMVQADVDSSIDPDSTKVITVGFIGVRENNSATAAEVPSRYKPNTTKAYGLQQHGIHDVQSGRFARNSNGEFKPTTNNEERELLLGMGLTDVNPQALTESETTAINSQLPAVLKNYAPYKDVASHPTTDLIVNQSTGSSFGADGYFAWVMKRLLAHSANMKDERNIFYANAFKALDINPQFEPVIKNENGDTVTEDPSTIKWYRSRKRLTGTPTPTPTPQNNVERDNIDRNSNEIDPTQLTISDPLRPFYNELVNVTNYNSGDSSVRVVELPESVWYRISNTGVAIFNHQQLERLVEKAKAQYPGTQPTKIQFERRVIHSSSNLSATTKDHWENTITAVTAQTEYTPTPTPLPTATMTPLPTETPTSTATRTVTPTYTITPTATITETSTRTPSATNTRTATPTLTITPTETWTATATITPTYTYTPTSTSTPSRTPTPTPDINATIEAAVSATIAAQTTPTPEPTSMPTETQIPIVVSSPQPSRTTIFIPFVSKFREPGPLPLGKEVK